MSETIRLKKGLDIQLKGEAEMKIVRLPLSSFYAVSPSDFEGVTPKLLVKVEDVVKAGSPLFFDKNRPEIIFTSPVSGKISAVNRGEKRKILDIIVEADEKQDYEKFEVSSLDKMSREDIIATMLKSGAWAYVIQRPYGVIANPTDLPKSIFISGFDSAPLAPDMNYALSDRFDDLSKGIEVLKKLTKGKVYLGVKERTSGVINKLMNAEQRVFSGPHPVGNVGVQIHHIDPINKGDIVWTVDVQNVAIIGKLFTAGVIDMSRVIALTGSKIERPTYISVISGAPIKDILAGNVVGGKKDETIRVISGNVLSGKKVNEEGYLTYFTNQVTVIPEGDKYEFLGWAKPRFNKFSVSKTYFSWLCPKKKYDLDTNLNGGHRPFIVTGLFEKYTPMDIYPMYLLKAILAQDIDKMENLGIYEIIEEDLALCEFVDPSKNDIQHIVRQGINLMIKELS